MQTTVLTPVEHGFPLPSAPLSVLAPLFVATEAWCDASPSACKAVSQYKDAEYWYYNRMLRGQTVPTDTDEFRNLVATRASAFTAAQTAEAQLAVLRREAQGVADAVAAGIQCGTPLVVYRGIDFVPEEQWTDAAVLSTSFDPNIALGFTRDTPNFMQLLIPPGTRGLFLDAINNTAEFEWVMPRGATFRRVDTVTWMRGSQQATMYRYELTGFAPQARIA